VSAIGSAFGLHFARNDGGAWASGVARFDVSDTASQRALGTLYVDLARRAGKPSGDGAYTLLPPRAGRAATVAIVTSWPGRSGTIDGDRLVDFYRLAGVAMAHLLPEVPYETLARVSPDAESVDAAVFERFAGAGAPGARAMLAKTAIAEIDLDFSSSGSHVDTGSVWQRVASATFTQLYVPGTYPQVATDAFAGDDAGLLVLRPWGQLYATDLFSVLGRGGQLDARAGERFRRTVLTPGAARRLEDEMHDFLGRDARAAMP
ncbi:MAG TPA: hypothetical protein VMF61_11380, partial [Candidatus Acidoferrales bacterium]|nr:hypothetical protein [Candidatus Acidoferrales bacterium]